MRKDHRRLSLALAVALAAALASATAASASNGSDFMFVPDSVQLPSPNLPGVGNDCSLLNPQDPPAPPKGCYDPAQIRQAYNIPSTYDGAGQTIIIVEAYGDPNIEADLAQFDSPQRFDLPSPPSFTVYNGSATQTAGPHDPGAWLGETALDVEWAHAIAPKANLVLIEASSSSGSVVNAAMRQIVPNYPGAIISLSFGIEESAISGGGNNVHVRQMHKNFELFRSLGDTIVASDGDFGASNGTNVNSPQYPASDPLVTSVGGTMGLPAPLGLCPPTNLLLDQCSYGGEQVWNEPAFGATGGGPSLIWGAPAYQPGPMRTVPDVAYNAAVNGGFLVAIGPHLGLFGGTSAGAPQWAAIIALINQARAQGGKPPLTFPDALYGRPNDFHDITVGNNTLPGAPLPGFDAGPGYDLATGLGTPNVANLIDDLK